ncbi:MAG TPA: NlpC/P60 family protein, partial [Candidatus Paceibacterota bacterium]
MDPWTQWIYQDAPKYGVDPRAADAISRGVEWPGRSGAGDAGTSFGPFQLHVGGALPRGRGRAWAESRAGVNYALRQMAAHGARGLRGPSAIAAISKNFERPANVAGEISKATAFYNAHAGQPGLGNGLRQLAAHTAQRIQKAPGGGQNKLALINFLLSNVQAYATTGSAYSPSALADLMLHQPLGIGKEVDSGRQVPIVGTRGVRKINPREQHIVQQAKKFLGTPYVWGGSKPGGFDCSGFVQYLYGQAGIRLGRTTYDQIKQGRPVGRKGLKPG